MSENLRLVKQEDNWGVNVLQNKGLSDIFAIL